MELDEGDLKISIENKLFWVSGLSISNSSAFIQMYCRDRGIHVYIVYLWYIVSPSPAFQLMGLIDLSVEFSGKIYLPLF